MDTTAIRNSRLTRGYSLAVVSAAILSTTAIFIRYLTQTYQLPPLVLAFWRDLFVAITLILVLAFLRPTLSHIDRRHLPYLVLYGFVLAIFNALWTLSVAINGAAVATVLVYCSAAFTALLGWWLLKESLELTKIATVVLCLGGCVLVAEAINPNAWQTNLVGILAGTISGLCYAIYSLMGRYASTRGLAPWTTVLYTFGIASAFLLAINLLPVKLIPGGAVYPADLFWLGTSLPGWGILLLLAAGPTVLGFGLYNVCLGYLPSSVANLILTLEPVFTALIAYLLLGERLSSIQVGGSLMILAGVVLLRITAMRSPETVGMAPVE